MAVRPRRQLERRRDAFLERLRVWPCRRARGGHARDDLVRDFRYTPGTSANERTVAGVRHDSWNIGGGKTETIQISIASHERVEAVALDLQDLVFAAANHLAITLTSPSGTVSHLLVGNGGDAAIDFGWRLMSRAFLGEDAYGVWTVTISSTDAADAGSLSRVTLNAFGSAMTPDSVHFYTDEFATLWTEDRAVLADPGLVSLDAAAVTGKVILDLARASGTIDGKPIEIASGTVVRTIVTGTGNDTIVGADSPLRAFLQDGDDKLSGSAQADEAHGGAGRDVIEGGAGDDRLFGDAGIDTVSYASATSGIQVNLGIVGWQDFGGAGRDLISGFERLTGSVFGDRLIGDAGDNWINGGEGSDLLVGGNGNDLLFGGAGVDTAIYTRAGSAIQADLAAGWAKGGAGRDRLEGIENLTGSASDDRLAGDASANRLVGGGGRRPARRPGRQRLPHRRPWRRRPDRRAWRRHIERRRRPRCLVVCFTRRCRRRDRRLRSECRPAQD